MVWTHSDYRGIGLSKKVIKDIVDSTELPIDLEVHKDNPAYNLSTRRKPTQQQVKLETTARVWIRTPADPPTLEAIEPPFPYPPSHERYAGRRSEARATHPSAVADGRHPARERGGRTPSRRRSILGSLSAERRQTPL